MNLVLYANPGKNINTVMGNDKLTTTEKLSALQLSKEMKTAAALLISAFEDCELKSHIRFTYKVKGVKYELTFLPIVNEKTYKNPGTLYEGENNNGK